MFDVVLRLHGDAITPDEASGAADDLDVAEECSDAVSQPVDDAVLPALGGGQVDVDVSDDAGAGGDPLPRAIEVVSDRDQRLRRDAPDVQAGPAQPRLLDEDDLAAELDGAGGRGVAARPAPDDEDVDRARDLPRDHQVAPRKSARGASSRLRIAVPKLMMSRPSTTR